MGRFTGSRGTGRVHKKRDHIDIDVERERAKLACDLCGARPPKHHPRASTCPGARPEAYIRKLLGDLAG